MKVTVNYGKRNFGNREPSKATEVRVDLYSSTCRIIFDFKDPQWSRSWDWASVGSVGGAEIELSIADAKALARTLLDLEKAEDKVNEQYDIMDFDRPLLHGRLRFQEGQAPKAEIVEDEPEEFDSDDEDEEF